MCGILGLLSKNNDISLNQTIKLLKRLEYRGYDSSGILYLNEKKEIIIEKRKGKIKNLENSINLKIKTNLTICHTRWATHGKPSDSNSHPHVSNNGNFFLVHNGIIENYKILKQILIDEGYIFYSETDSEVLVNFIEFICLTNTNNSYYQNVVKALSKISGTYGIILYSKLSLNDVIVVKKGSPIVLGLSDNQIYISSDYYSFLEETQNVITLKDNELAIIDRTSNNYEIKNIITQEVINPNISQLNIKIDQIEKSVFKHFMLKEIMNQHESIKDCMRGRITDSFNVKLGGIEIKKNNDTLIHTLSKCKKIIICGCGTSLNAGLIGKYIIEEIADIPVEVEQASEFRYRKKATSEDTVLIGISQSGETADTLEAIKSCKNKMLCLGICNIVGSSISYETDGGIYLHVGPEIGVASTKAFTGQLTVLYMLAIRLAQLKNINLDKSNEIIKNLINIPDIYLQIKESLTNQIKNMSKIFKFASNFLFLGRGYNYPIALEAALKLKEISYIHAEGYSAAEMKHGPIALIDKMMPVVVIAIKDNIYSKVCSNIEEVHSRGGSLIIITNEDNKDFDSMTENIIRIPHIEEHLYPFLTILPLQLLSYYIALERGCNVDQPRNLAKCVTVE